MKYNYTKYKKDFNYHTIEEYFEDDLRKLLDNYIMETKKHQYVNEGAEQFFEDNDRMDRYYDIALSNLVYLLRRTYNSKKLLCKKTNNIINNPNYNEELEWIG